ncbi:MAG: DUF2147 domain-containing protein [Bacteroidota bacterium]
MKLLWAAFIFSLFAFQSPENESSKDSQILGTWLSPKKEIKIQIFKKDNAFHGKIIWIKKGSAYSRYQKDLKNPKPALRQRPLIGLQILNGFKYDQRGMSWSMGRIYHPKYGKFFKGKMSLKDTHTLKITGYWGMFKDAGIWTKAI